jgi:hypothetical protein
MIPEYGEYRHQVLGGRPPPELVQEYFDDDFW